MSNRLADASSPYLLQHKENPVDWYPWGDAAFERARSEAKPIFLSIGYSACHWCHVMERESFEDIELAKILNDHFVAIKVDREQRPDLDHIYMQAVQTLTGRGGWPMSVFLTEDGQPFYGGTYWPPRSQHGMPGFNQVLTSVADAWQNRREQITEQASRLTASLQGRSCTVITGRARGGGSTPSGSLRIGECFRSDKRWDLARHPNFRIRWKSSFACGLRGSAVKSRLSRWLF